MGWCCSRNLGWVRLPNTKRAGRRINFWILISLRCNSRRTYRRFGWRSRLLGIDRPLRARLGWAVLLKPVVGKWLAVADFGFKPLQGVVQPFLMGGRDRLKLDTNPPRAAPADHGMFNQDRSFVSGNIEEKIHLHACDGPKGTFEPTPFAREIQ